MSIMSKHRQHSLSRPSVGSVVPQLAQAFVCCFLDPEGVVVTAEILPQPAQQKEETILDGKEAGPSAAPGAAPLPKK